MTGTEPPPAPCSVLVIGGGASGVIAAAHLLRAGAPLTVTVIEKRESLGRGIAYGTAEPDHLLNVRASNMSALAAEPRHFTAWLEASGFTGNPDTFYAPRRDYGHYLGGIAAGLTASGRLRHVRALCRSVEATGGGVRAETDGGGLLRADAAILACGHEEHRLRERPYAVRLGDGEAAEGPLDPEAPVLILGTGLSTVDVWLSLRRRGHRGPITALSRRGLLPAGHRRLMPPAAISREDLPLGASPASFLGWLRARARAIERQGGDWRTAIDALRPFNQAIWQSWTAPEQRRFLRHAKTPWHVHRHRMAPEIFGAIAQARAGGALRVLAGRLAGVERAGEGWRAAIRRGGACETLAVARIYDCTGVATDPAESSNPAIRSLLDGGAARCDPMHVGLDVTEDCALVDRDGTPSDRLFAVGPLTRGTFLEIEAVPDIRIQCARLAERLAGHPPAATAGRAG